NPFVTAVPDHTYSSYFSVFKEIALPAHTVKSGVAVIVGVKLSLTITVTSVLLLSQPNNFWVTQYFCSSAFTVEGVGAVVITTEFASYHVKTACASPVASKGVEGELTQYDLSGDVGGSGIEFITTFVLALLTSALQLFASVILYGRYSPADGLEI